MYRLNAQNNLTDLYYYKHFADRMAISAIMAFFLVFFCFLALLQNKRKANDFYLKMIF